MATLSVMAPDQGATKQTKARMKTAQFGDGYAQEVLDGINNLYEVWTLAWTGKTRTEITTIDNFFKANLGVWFYWTTPDGVQKKFKCREWSVSYNNDFDCSITSATLVQDFGV